MVLYLPQHRSSWVFLKVPLLDLCFSACIFLQYLDFSIRLGFLITVTLMIRHFFFLKITFIFFGFLLPFSLIILHFSYLQIPFLLLWLFLMFVLLLCPPGFFSMVFS